MRILFTLLFCCSICFAQKKPFPLQWEKSDLHVAITQFITGAANGTSDAIQFHGVGAGMHWVDYNTSWKNKYKNYDAGDTRAAYFGSKSFFVAGTDAFHALRASQRSLTTFTIIIDRTDVKSWKKIIQKTLLIYLTNRLGFNLLYNVIFPTK